MYILYDRTVYMYLFWMTDFYIGQAIVQMLKAMQFKWFYPTVIKMRIDASNWAELCREDNTSSLFPESLMH